MKNRVITRLIFCFFIFFSFFSLGFITAKKAIFPHNLIYAAWTLLDKPPPPNKQLDICKVPSISKIPDESTIVIGHAYGSPNDSQISDFIDPSVHDFLIRNKENVARVIFTGDVFAVPSLEKWERLQKEFDGYFDIDVAPGNHDIYRPDSKEAFVRSSFGSKPYPYILFGKPPIVVDNSIESHWEVSKETLTIINSINTDIYSAT